MRVIQDALGQKYGDFAGMYFAGPDGDAMRSLLLAYLVDERGNLLRGSY